MDPNLQALRARLSTILDEAAEGRILLAQLGSRLRAETPDFAPQRHGARNLKDLLSQFPDVGAVQHGDDPLEWWFSRIDQRLERDWWRAVTSCGDGQRHWYDVVELRLVSDPELVAKEPYRFAELPHFGVDEQRAIASSWVGQLPEAEGGALLPVLEEEGLAGLRAAVKGAGLGASWERARRRAIITEVIAWCRKHDIDPPLTVATARRTTPGRRTHSSTDALRSCLHRAIDRMSPSELRSLPIPARLLLDE